MTFTQWYSYQTGYSFSERELRERHGSRYDSYIENMKMNYITSCVGRHEPVQIDI